jgi:hypothetical protein
MAFEFSHWITLSELSTFCIVEFKRSVYCYCCVVFVDVFECYQVTAGADCLPEEGTLAQPCAGVATFCTCVVDGVSSFAGVSSFVWFLWRRGAKLWCECFEFAFKCKRSNFSGVVTFAFTCSLSLNSAAATHPKPAPLTDWSTTTTQPLSPIWTHCAATTKAAATRSSPTHRQVIIWNSVWTLRLEIAFL